MQTNKVTGLENAIAKIQANPGKGNKGDKFADVFKNKDADINTFSDFFQWKIDQSVLKHTQEGDSESTEPPIEILE